MDAVRRRQEKELQKIIQKEQAMVNLQQKLQRSEEEEVKRKREHEKKVREAKILAEKKQTQRLHERAEKVSDLPFEVLFLLFLIPFFFAWHRVGATRGGSSQGSGQEGGGVRKEKAWNGRAS